MTSGQGRAERGARRRLRGGLHGFSPRTKVLQRFVKIIDDSWVWTGTTALRGAGPRSAPRRKSDVGLVVPLSKRCLTWRPEHYFWQTLALVYMRQYLDAFVRISCGFLREGTHES